jgi:hypothetical protein
MLIDRNARPWILGSGLLLAAAVAVYIFQARRTEILTGGSWLGLSYGAVGSAMILVCMLLSARKAMRRSAKLGRTFQWMQAHVWLGLISYPIIWLHAGFRVGGTLTTFLMVLFTAIWLSGIVGLFLQRSIPRQICNELPAATVYEQISHVVAELRGKAQMLIDRMVGQLAGAVPAGAQRAASADAMIRRSGGLTAVRSEEAVATLRTHVELHVTPLLADAPRLGGGVKGMRVAENFVAIREQMPDVVWPALAELEEVVRERLQLARQHRLHSILHGWLLIHVPLSYLMLILSIVHALGALPFARLR